VAAVVHDLHRCGAENTITGSIQGIGTNLLFVFRGGSEDVRNPKPITLGDADAIADDFWTFVRGRPGLQGSDATAPARRVTQISK
jgi:hypothetical protein